MSPRARLETWPLGYFTADFRGRRYGVTRSLHAGGRSHKLFARELGGSDVVSLNLYAPAGGEDRLRPCEMPAEKVLAFLAEARPLAAEASPA